jgi:excisionase family DNA binding protein
MVVSREFLTLSEAAKRLSHISEPALRRLVRLQEIETIRAGRRILVPSDALAKRYGALFRPAS